LVGPWIAAVQSLVKKIWNVEHNVIFSSGVSAKRLATRIMETPGLLGEDDAGFWDKSLHRKIMLAEVRICDYFGVPRATRRLILTNVDKRGRTTKGLRYRTLGQRASGDPYTTLFNTIWNIFIHMFLIARENANSLTLVTLRWDEVVVFVLMAAAGDDNIMRIATNLRVPNFAVQMARLGIDSKFLNRVDPLTAEFCSNRIYEVEGGYTFSPKPGRILSKLGYFIQPPPLRRVSRESLVRGTALGLVKACWHIAPLRVYLSRLLELTKGHKAFYAKPEDWKLHYEVEVETPATIQSLEVNYGFANNHLRYITAAVGAAALGDVVDHPFFNLLCDRDTGGVQLYF